MSCILCRGTNGISKFLVSLLFLPSLVAINISSRAARFLTPILIQIYRVFYCNFITTLGYSAFLCSSATSPVRLLEGRARMVPCATLRRCAGLDPRTWDCELPTSHDTHTLTRPSSLPKARSMQVAHARQGDMLFPHSMYGVISDPCRHISTYLTNSLVDYYKLFLQIE